ncbi:MAG: DUF3189 family protein [Firmicutes bacterium]|nr:DUF3189 family protein [Bacillota bacterium]
MKVIYACYGGAHSSPLAAAIHLGRIQGDPLPSLEDIANVLYFDIVDGEDRGRVFPVGVDEYGNEIFVLGRGSRALPIEQAVKSGFILAGADPRQLLFVNSLRAVNWEMRIGGFLSRRLRLVALGRPLVTRGARRAYPRLVEIVNETKQYLNAAYHKAEPVYYTSDCAPNQE